MNSSGDETIVSKFIKNGGNVNVVNKFSMTPLHVAVQEIKLKIVNLLIKHGAQINLLDSRGRTPLEVNGQYGNLKIYFNIFLIIFLLSNKIM